MATRPISSRVHGILDYATGAALLAAPGPLGLRGTPAGWALRCAGGGTVAYSLMTAYELGVRRVLPYRTHLAVDAAAAVGLAAAPWALGTARRGAGHWLPHALVAMFELGAVALSDPSGRGAQGAAGQTLDVPAAGKAGSGIDPGTTVMPEGAEAALAARGAAARRGVNGGGVGSGAGPGSDPRPGLQT